MSLINISNLTFSYDGGYANIFENVSFQIDTDWKLGFIGRNGRGKTTFLNLLMKKYEYRGTITGSVSFDYFPFAVEDGSLFTQDIILSLDNDIEQWKINREFSLLELPEDILYRRFNTLSGGERTKALLAGLFSKESNFLLIDEPTNHLDYHARELVGDYLKSKKGFILVSHDREFLDRCIDHVLSINRADIEVQRGNFSTWWTNKQMKDSFELSENEKLKKEIKRLTVAARQAAGWSDKVEKTKYGTLNSGIKPDKGYIGHKSAKMMKRAKSIETRRMDAAEEKSTLLKNIESCDKLILKPLIHHTEKLIELKDVSICYGQKIVCSELSLTVTRGDRVAVRGKNGSGKSSVFKAITGSDSLTLSGLIKTAGGLTISYVPQDTSFLKGSLKDFSTLNNLDESLFKAILRKLDFDRTQFDVELDSFSAGQKKKVLIAKSLCESAHLYIWDEPLNFVDVLSRIQIEDLILGSSPTMLFVEHDNSFVEKIATKTITL